eukprot:TRINITY_DN67806_c4_g13_i1.p1 TRINITY_DN67806_c4_g13~~TRINITY_DN67806_c4_g13_i1.p1  ORF type:complete len:123 (-),score=22.10 TRINITY_DN67806_c4_g13_i1:168-536(-)
MARKQTKRPGKKQKLTTIETTVHLHRRMYGKTFKDRAPSALKVIREQAFRTMRTKDVRIDTKLNKFLWSKGIKHVPHRVRVRMERKHSEEEDAKEKLYTLVSWVPCINFKGQKTRHVVDEEE